MTVVGKLLFSVEYWGPTFVAIFIDDVARSRTIWIQSLMYHQKTSAISTWPRRPCLSPVSCTVNHESWIILIYWSHSSAFVSWKGVSESEPVMDEKMKHFCLYLDFEMHAYISYIPFRFSTMLRWSMASCDARRSELQHPFGWMASCPCTRRRMRHVLANIGIFLVIFCTSAITWTVSNPAKCRGIAQKELNRQICGWLSVMCRTTWISRQVHLDVRSGLVQWGQYRSDSDIQSWVLLYSVWPVSVPYAAMVWCLWLYWGCHQGSRDCDLNADCQSSRICCSLCRF